MSSMKSSMNSSIKLCKEPWGTFLSKYILMVLFYCYHCKAQCSIPPAGFLASLTPRLIFSPNYPDRYLSDTTCHWLINSPIDAGRIQLRVVDNDFACCCDTDYLLIKDGRNSSSRTIAILCSDLNPVTITSSRAALYGEFHSNADGNAGFGYTLQFDYFDSTLTCPSEWMGLNGYCYKLYNEPLPWEQAASRCGYDGGFLTSIVDEEENNFIVDTFIGQGSVVWIGMDIAGNWLDGSSSLVYNNFAGESPSISDCSVIDLDNNGRWSVADCSNQQLGFICKKTQDGSGGRYWTEVDHSAVGDSGSLGVGSIVAITFFPLFFCWILCCSGSNRDKWLITRTLSTLCSRLRDFFSCLCDTLVCIVCCRCLRHDDANARDHQDRDDMSIHSLAIQPSALRYRVSLTGDTSDRESLSSLESGGRPRAVTASLARSPPTYGDVTSEPPPPSYHDALDPTFDVSEMRSSRTNSLNVGESIAPAPSYESVVGSDGYI